MFGHSFGHRVAFANSHTRHTDSKFFFASTQRHMCVWFCVYLYLSFVYRNEVTPTIYFIYIGIYRDRHKNLFDQKRSHSYLVWMKFDSRRSKWFRERKKKKREKKINGFLFHWPFIGHTAKCTYSVKWKMRWKSIRFMNWRLLLFARSSGVVHIDVYIPQIMMIN